MNPNDLAARLTPPFLRRMARRGIHPRPVTQTELTAFSVWVALWLASIAPGVAAAPPPGPPVRNPLLDTIDSLDGMMDTYERVDLLDQAVSHIPLDQLHMDAEAIQATNEPLSCYEDALAQALVKWFKPTFFKWVDPIMCPTCQGPTEMRDMVKPTEEELKGGANRVELHSCKKNDCHGSFRFPRYNDPSVLMKTRIGRCGEFANLFCLFIRAIGLRARYVWNAEDHVWNEYWSPGLNRWVHLDSCENVRDESLLYDRGWGKKMSYCLAFSAEGGPEDVTKGYVVNWTETLSRRERIGEEQLSIALSAARERRRFGLSADEVTRLGREDAAQVAWLESGHARVSAPANEPGRQSGTQEWKEERGETGRDQTEP